MLLAYIISLSGVLFLSLLWMASFIIEMILHFIILNKYLVVVFGTTVENLYLHSKPEEWAKGRRGCDVTWVLRQFKWCVTEVLIMLSLKATLKLWSRLFSLRHVCVLKFSVLISNIKSILLLHFNFEVKFAWQQTNMIVHIQHTINMISKGKKKKGIDMFCEPPSHQVGLL